MDPKIEKKRLLAAIYIEPEIIEQAQEVLIKARRKVGFGPSVITSIVVGLCHFAWTRTVPTFQVHITGDGNPMLLVNPDFAIKIGYDNSATALTHEAYHLLFAHLYVDPYLSQNENFILATEACINHRIMIHLNLPLISVDGKVAIVDPGSVYDRWRKAMQAASLPVCTKEEFFATDIGCFSYLEQCPIEIKPFPKGGEGMSGCVHSNRADGKNGQKPPPLDPSEVGKFMEKVLSQSIQGAKNGRKGAKEEILAWVDASPEASKMWGDLGAGTLRGETTVSRKTDLWERWTQEAMATRMADGDRPRYNRKLPFDPRISAVGRVPKKYGCVFIDASGSMVQAFLDRLVLLIGEIDNLTVEWHSFDGEVWPFVAGEPLRGGGGTSFQIIDDHLQHLGPGQIEGVDQCCDDEPDFVLVVTDGQAPHITPTDPEKWIWLVTPGGDSWAQDQNMSCREIDLDE